MNTAKSEVVYSNPKRGAEMPMYKLTGGALCSDLLRYLDVTFHQTLNDSLVSACSQIHACSSSSCACVCAEHSPMQQAF